MGSVKRERVEEVLKTVRPFLQKDDGDVEFVSIENDNIVKIRLLGSCHGCPMSLMTLRAGIERLILKEIPEVKRVESVD